MHLRGGEVRGHAVSQRLCEQSTSQDGDQVVGHEFLLIHGAMVLQGQDDWIL